MQPNLAVSEKFEWVCNYYKRMSGSEYLGFNNATFLSEKEAADRNYAIAYYLKEYKCFPKNAVLKDTMDFYFQVMVFENQNYKLNKIIFNAAVFLGSQLRNSELNCSYSGQRRHLSAD